MIITLCASSLADLLTGRSTPAIALNDLPAYTRDTLGLAGLRMTTDLLAGADRSTLGKFRDACDRARCSCLVLHEPVPQPLTDVDAGETAAKRIRSVLTAGGLLGCTSVSCSVAGDDTEDGFETAVEHLKSVMEQAERLSINLLLVPEAGLTSDPVRLTTLIKRVGGFRLGTCPDFLAASEHDDPQAYLKRITPYAAAVVATTTGFDVQPTNIDGTEIDLTEPNVEAALAQAVEEEPAFHTGYDLTEMIAAVRAVGYDQTLSIRYQGEGDPRVGVMQSRVAIDFALEMLTGGGEAPAVVVEEDDLPEAGPNAPEDAAKQE